MRDYNHEFQDVPEKKYAYDFDALLRKYMMRTFAALLPKGKALELGCFRGDVTELLVSHYPDLTVIEAADELIAMTQKRLGGNIKYIHSSFETAELKDQYDAIFLVHTLEHLNDPILVLKKINSWLSKTGKLFLVVPNANAPSRQIAVKMGLISHNSAVTEAEHLHGHRVTYSFDTLEKDAKASGLNITSRGGIFFKPMANYQLDKALAQDIITLDYMDGCYDLGMQYPDLCASIYLICERGQQ